MKHIAQRDSGLELIGQMAATGYNYSIAFGSFRWKDVAIGSIASRLPHSHNLARNGRGILKQPGTCTCPTAVLCRVVLVLR